MEGMHLIKWNKYTVLIRPKTFKDKFFEERIEGWSETLSIKTRQECWCLLPYFVLRWYRKKGEKWEVYREETIIY